MAFRLPVSACIATFLLLAHPPIEPTVEPQRVKPAAQADPSVPAQRPNQTDLTIRIENGIRSLLIHQTAA
ncbi:MAG: hypothetical protein NC819_04560 [Candidatus Omnitrophica bacterium]|nr:hypothetical protein [Candidatus Omnitrophota bacterium]